MQGLPFVVGIVVPSLGGLAQVRLRRADRERAIRTVLEAFEGWFGGGTPMRIPPGGIVRLEDGTVVLDPDQIVVVSGTTRACFRRHRPDIAKLAERVGQLLRQESIAVLAFATSDSLLVFPKLSKGK